MSEVLNFRWQIPPTPAYNADGTYSRLAHCRERLVPVRFYWLLAHPASGYYMEEGG